MDQVIQIGPGRYRAARPGEVQAPAPRPPCAHLGPPTGETVACPTCPSNTAAARHVPLLACLVHGRTTGQRGAPGTRSCHHCTDYAPGAQAAAPAYVPFTGDLAGSIHVNHGAGGLGDALLGLAAIGGLKAAHPDRAIVYGVQAGAIPFCALFAGGYDHLVVHDSDGVGDLPPRADPRTLQINYGYQAEIRSRCAVPRWQRYCKNVGGVDPVLPTLRDPGRLRALGADYAGAIVLAPFSTFQSREWRIESWLGLERALAAAGYRTVVLDRTDHRWPNRHAPLASPKVLNATAERVAGIIAASACVVGNDSGLAHLAGLMGHPTVALCGTVTGRQIFGLYPRVTWLQGGLPCDGCWWQAPYEHARCDTTCASMQTITPADVLAAVDAHTGRRSVADEPIYAALRGLGRRHRPRSYLEIGVREGDSLRCVLASAPIERLVLADTWGGLYGGSDRRGHAHIDALLARLGWAGQVDYLDGDSAITLPQLGGVYDLVTVDADHSAAGAMRDLENALPRLAVGGHLVFDDITHPAHQDLAGVADAFGARHQELARVIEDRSGNGLVVWRRELRGQGSGVRSQER